MLGKIREKMAIQASTRGGGRFSTSSSIVIENNTSTCSDLCTPSAPSRFSPHNVECKKGEAAFIEKFFTNRKIKTSVQTRYLRFKGMSYKSESYLCDIKCVQLWKALARFRCGNLQLEVMLGAWKGVPYAERLC